MAITLSILSTKSLIHLFFINLITIRREVAKGEDVVSTFTTPVSQALLLNKESNGRFEVSAAVSMEFPWGL